MKKQPLNYYITHFGKLSKPEFVYVFVILVRVGIIIYKNEYVIYQNQLAHSLRITKYNIVFGCIQKKRPRNQSLYFSKDLHKLHWQEIPFHNFKRLLKVERFWADLICCVRLFHILATQSSQFFFGKNNLVWSYVRKFKNMLLTCSPIGEW